MNEKREVILPSDFSGEKGKIVCYRISSYLELLYIDIMNEIFRISSVKEERGIDYPFARTMSMSLSVTF